MPVTKDDLRAALTRVVDPELQRDLETLGAVQHVAYCDGLARIELTAGHRSEAQQAELRQAVIAALKAVSSEVQRVEVSFRRTVSLEQANSKPAEPEKKSPQEQAREDNPLPGVKHIIAVGAGKGGVGKSSIAVNLAVGLARAGHAVGILDGDIYGPSLPTMLGLHDEKPQAQGEILLPFEKHGMRSMTLGVLVDDEKPLIWRGPMAHGAFRQLVTQTAWGDLEYLIIDLPPGTGDVPLTMAQLLPLTGAVVVCTPQKVAQDDARRAVRMFQQLGVEVLGVVENMSYFVGDDGKVYDIFGRGGAEHMAIELGVPCLGTVPINTRLRVNADAGEPSANYTGEDALASELESLVRRFVQQVQVQAMSESAQRPSLSIR